MRTGNLLEMAYRLLIRAGDLLQPVILLIFRLNWGWQFFVTGRGKLMNHADIVSFFTDLHIPFPDLNAWFVGGLECVGGLLLIAGIASRPIALLLTANMTVAYLSVESDRATVLNLFKDQNPFLQADPFFFLLTSVVILAFGPGLISVDSVLGKFVFNKKKRPLD